MPADYESTAQALAVSPSRSSPTSPWFRRSNSVTSRRLETMPMRSLSTSGSAMETVRRLWVSVNQFGLQVQRTYEKLSPLQKVLAIAVCILGWVVLILMIMYSHSFFSWLAPVAKAWRSNPAGWLIIFVLIFVMSFPPVIGYSTVNTVAGFVYGFPLGWPIIAAAATVGSTAAFIASRTVLSGYVNRMVGHDHRFRALGHVLRQEGVLYLTAIRCCPLPFSLSNGFLATIPTISPMTFALATALSTPKLLVHVWIGSRLALLAEEGDEMSAGDKAINYIGIAIGGIIGFVAGLAIYRRTMARAAQLAEEDAADTAAEEGDGGYEDNDGTLLDPEDAAAIMSDDDVSLWEQEPEMYHDTRSSTDEDDAQDWTRNASSNGKSNGHL
ncbi:hypothetical protein B0I35DRAFT_41999 [Stachybotrys elegans]|uniref:Golgi apparatus membrane protein TVP38 n=1 Tax=Stachybotrys elegans TaxID=80388 RepID=A0A8K0T3Q8_9HYPO|nr:hypothetical protein B0I35DRAFT_41999 [Stachybotrys elegans]